MEMLGVSKGVLKGLMLSLPRGAYKHMHKHNYIAIMKMLTLGCHNTGKTYCHI